MNELSIAAKFLFTVASIAVACYSVGSLGHLTYKMAEVAIEAQQHDQMSWGRFSHTLWGTHKTTSR